MENKLKSKIVLFIIISLSISIFFSSQLIICSVLRIRRKLIQDTGFIQLTTNEKGLAFVGELVFRPLGLHSAILI
jgi:hypothetical protein